MFNKKVIVSFFIACVLWMPVDAESFTVPDLPAASKIGCLSPTILQGMCLSKECNEESQGHFVFAAQEDSLRSGGMQFCTVYVDSWRKNTTKQSVATWYTATPGNSAAPRCVWLCEDGWGGKECNTKGESNLVEPQKISTSLYSVMAKVSDEGDNIYINEDDWTTIRDCNDTQFGQRSADRNQQHEVTYGVVGWLPSGHGARVAPIAARAFCGRNKTKDDCRIIIDIVGPEQYLCMIGYKLDATGRDCILSTTENVVTDCDGWAGSDFASSDYIKITKDGCYQYRCAKSGYGFKGNPKATNPECVECPTSMRQGVSQIDGECVITDNGYIFNPSATSKEGESVKASELNFKDFLKRDSDNIPCWMTDDFKKCLAEE